MYILWTCFHRLEVFFSQLPTKFAEADNISNIKFDWHGIIRRLMCVISNVR